MNNGKGHSSFIRIVQEIKYKGFLFRLGSRGQKARRKQEKEMAKREITI